MNPLASRIGTVIAGFVLAAIAIVVFGPAGQFNPWEFWVWMHVIVGIAWVGLLYYFNFIQVPAVTQAVSDGDPGPAAINKYIAPRALFWFRYAAILTWFTGAAALEAMHAADGSGVVAAFTFQEGYRIIGMGAWLGTIMLFNVWLLTNDFINNLTNLGTDEVTTDSDRLQEVLQRGVLHGRVVRALRQVKAATLHGLEVGGGRGGWHLAAVVDI